MGKRVSIRIGDNLSPILILLKIKKMSKFLGLGLFVTGAFLLSNNKKSHIGKVYDSKPYTKGLVPCRNGRYSDSYPTPGTCSSNGGIDIESVYTDYIENSLGEGVKNVTVSNDKLTIYFGKKTYHSIKRIDQLFSNRKMVKDVKMVRYFDGNDTLKSLELTASFKNRTSMNQDFENKLRWLQKNLR